MAIVISGVNNNDRITAADGTIDLLSGVNYAGIITAPAFTTPGNFTAGHLNIGSGIQLGNAGVATATTFVGNLTGNVNATSNLLLQIGGSEKFRVGSSGQLGIGGANYGTSGQVLTSGGSGGAATWSTITGTTINNQSDNRMITCTGTSNTLNAEQYLTYTSQSSLNLTDGNGTSNLGGNYLLLKRTTGNTNYINAPLANADLVISADENLLFHTVHTADYNSTERARIDSSGRLLIGTTATDDRDGYNSSLQVAGTGGDDSSISIGRYSADTSYPALVFSKSRNAAINSHTRVNTGDYLGGIQFQGDDGTRFLVGANIVAQAASPVADYDMATDLIISTNSGTTSPNKSMTLDHQGRFTTPNQPFVMVHINTATNRNTTGSQMVIPWDQIHGRSTNSNMGSHFNTSNHRFTAPVDGRYLFVVSLNIIGDNIVYHRINGTNVHGGEYRMTQLVWDHVDTSIIYDMNANDYYDMTSQLYDGSGQRWNSGGTGDFGWDCLSIYLLG